MSKKEFVTGFYVKEPNEKAPDFIKCQVSIKRADFGNWLREHEDEWINIDVKVSKEGKWYAERNTWSPDKKAKKERFDKDIPF